MTNLHRYIFITGPLNGQRLQDINPRHTPEGYLFMPAPLTPPKAIDAADAAPTVAELDAAEYVIVASECHRCEDETIALYYAVPATWNPSDAILSLCRLVTRYQNFAHEVQEIYGPTSEIANSARKYGVKS